MFSLKTTKGFPKTDKFLNKMLNVPDDSIFKKYGELGVIALSNGTPVDTGLTADSWVYEIKKNNGRVEISFYNTNNNEGENIALLLQYGHGTRNGGYVKGRDYINPSLQPVFDAMAEDAWKEVRGI